MRWRTLWPPFGAICSLFQGEPEADDGMASLEQSPSNGSYCLSKLPWRAEASPVQEGNGSGERRESAAVARPR